MECGQYEFSKTLLEDAKATIVVLFEVFILQLEDPKADTTSPTNQLYSAKVVLSLSFICLCLSFHLSS